MKKIIITLVVCLNLFIFTNIFATTLSDYQNQLESIKAEQKAVADKLTGLEKEIATDLYDMINLDSKITEFSISLNDLQKKVDEVNAKLKEQEDGMQNSAQLYNSAEEIYKTRLRIIYENGIPTIFDVLLSSQSISEFFSRINVLNSIIDYDKSLVSNMQSQKEYIDYIKKIIELQKAQLDQLKYDTEKSSKSLDDAKIAKENKMNQLENSKVNLKAKQEALLKQEEDAAKKIKAEIAKLSNSTGSFNGKFGWPVPNFPYVSAYYGQYDPWKTGKTHMHYGVDIAGGGIFGKPIVAVESGTIILAKYYSGYGNCVIIDHGKNISDGANYRTIYGHASSLNVNVGQKVVKGQTIAFVGSTGNSTGPHLHIEVLKNGTNVNPILYIR